MIYLQNIKDSQIVFTTEYGIHVREYYNYCLDVLRQYLKNNNVAFNFIFGNFNVNFENSNKTIKLDIQFEHTLVKEGGRSVSYLIYGNTKHESGNYLVRIDNFEYYNSLDIVIDYSLSNIYNIKDSKKFEDFSKKMIYISPTIYDIDFDKTEKKDILALFIKNNNQRRSLILEDLDKNKIEYNNVVNCFSKEDLLEVYKKSKILINLHQTDHHHTFEELRILPALMNGVIIISEDSALKEKVPYHEYIIWSKYDDIVNKVKEVSENYEYYYHKIFADGNLRKIISSMKEENNKSFDKILS